MNLIIGSICWALTMAGVDHSCFNDTIVVDVGQSLSVSNTACFGVYTGLMDGTVVVVRDPLKCIGTEFIVTKGLVSTVYTEGIHWFTEPKSYVRDESGSLVRWSTPGGWREAGHSE